MKKNFLFLVIFFCILLTARAVSIPVSNAEELKIAHSKALPGDVIILQNGKWENIDFKITCNGTKGKPILFKAATRGAVIITGKSSLRIGGNWIIVDGLTFAEGYTPKGNVWEFKDGNQIANNSRITNCLIKSFNNPDRMKENYWVTFYGKNNRIDHNSFIDKTNMGVLLAVILQDDRSRLNNHLIDSNYFGYRKPLGSNTGEIIRIGVSEYCTFYSNTKVENNLFEHCDGETEIISIKSCGNLVRNNVFKECQGAVVLRHGNNNTIESNFFLGNGKEGSGGVRVINEGNWIINNYFLNCVGEGFRSPLAVMNGVFNSPPARYLPVRDAVIANNTFSNCTPFSLGEGSDPERSIAPRNVYIFNNLFYSNKETVSFNYFDKLDSIYFKGNVINSKIKPTSEKGFEQKNIDLSIWHDQEIPSYSSSTSNIQLPDSMLVLAPKRLKTGLRTSIGSLGIQYFSALEKQSKNLGISWKQNVEKPVKHTQKPFACKNAEALYNYLSGKEDEYFAELTGSEYVFNRPIIITKKTKIIARNQQLVFISPEPIASLFEMKGFAQLYFTYLLIDAAKMKTGQFISADSLGTCIHITLDINHCSISNLNGTAFLNTFISSYADMISIKNSKFISNTTQLFKLSDERENKGYYNVEKMVIDNCVFENNKGQILGLYRGGTDESTMGPKLFFTNNKIKNCTNDKELIYLFGVQQSAVFNNQFNNANPSKMAILYADNVRAKHEQKNNQYSNSGIVTENKFVTNLK